jgi:lipopolysaccharide transport system permease protein
MSAIKRINTLIELTKSDFKLRYKNTYFGLIWYVMNPILMLTTLYVVFSIVMKINLPFYQIFLLIGIIVWNFFVEATTLSMNSLISKSELIKKMKFPTELLVMSSCLLSLTNLVINLIILWLMMAYFGISFHPFMLISVFYLFLLFILVLGISYFLSSFYLFFRDLSHIWSFLLMLGFWVTPIVYSEMQIPIEFRKYYMLNPLARLINHLRDSLLNNYFSVEQALITLIVCFSILLLGIFFFTKSSSKFAEEL